MALRVIKYSLKIKTDYYYCYYHYIYIIIYIGMDILVCLSKKKKKSLYKLNDDKNYTWLTKTSCREWVWLFLPHQACVDPILLWRLQVVSIATGNLSAMSTLWLTLSSLTATSSQWLKILRNFTIIWGLKPLDTFGKQYCPKAHTSCITTSI